MSEIRDPIYGFITPSETEFQIINTHLLQRLRYIKQLAMAYLVYPGANHTRFDHSLGVYYIASAMAKKLLPDKDDEERRRIIRLAALLHDVGHGPFSHVSEDILEKYSITADTTQKEKIHEKITEQLIEHDESLERCMSTEDKKKVVGLLSGKSYDFTIMKEIVSGPLDADKMDYLLRDSHFCGVKYGVFDLYRMLNTLTVYKEYGDKHIAISHDGVNSLEQFALAKYYMTTQVYRHKVRSVTDAMIIRGLELGIEKDDLKFLKMLFCYRNEKEYIDNYLGYWDERLINEIIFSKKKGLARDIFMRLFKRVLFKRIFSERVRNIQLDNERFRDKLIGITLKENVELRRSIEKKISESEIIDCGKDFVILNSFTIKSVREMSRDSEGGIIVIDKDRNKTSFEKESTVFQSIDETMKDIFIEVYVPITYIDRQDRRYKLQIIKKEILEILRETEG